MRCALWLCLPLVGCASSLDVEQVLSQTQQTITMARQVYAPLCAPVEIARAEANVDFARLELLQAQASRAEHHALIAQSAALKALEISTPCGAADDDKDTVPNILDKCPDEKEDLDGSQDDDGCRDIEPAGDEDGDGIVNIDDGCIDEPEDMDGHKDDDGCPETSEDTDGDTVIDEVDACPDEPEDIDGFNDSDGCPDIDNDADGLIDINDTCPLVAEDLDGWNDEDGCPDPDNDDDGIPDATDNCPNSPGVRDKAGCPVDDADQDGIADAVDNCPNEPETLNNYLDEDGCPDTPPTRVLVTQNKVEITETLKFETGRATLVSSSFAVLDDIVTVLNDAPQISLRIEGHTDNEGSESGNLALSQKRAESVRAYLIKKGVQSTRLTAKGLGETQPIDTNRTPTGRAKNRRVEFHIVNERQ